MLKIEKCLKNYETSLSDLVELFITKYYTYEDGDRADDYHLVSFGGPLRVNDDRWDINEIYLSLKNDFKYDIMVEYKEMEMKKYPKRLDFSFYYFCKNDKKMM